MPSGKPSDSHSRYERALSGLEPPFAFVDLDALEANSATMLAQSGGLPIRVASKSVRSVPLLRRILDLDTGFRGILAFTLPEALWLAERGFDDVVLGYPTADRAALSGLARRAASGKPSPCLMVDCAAHLDLVESAAQAENSTLSVAIDLDAGWWPWGGRLARIGPKRSPVRTPAQAEQLARDAMSRPGVRLDGAMAYEGHIAGVGDRIPGRPLRSRAIQAMQSASMRDIARRVPALVDAMRSAGAELRFVNGGGTGSLSRTAAAGAVTELTAGSGFYAPGLFDTYRSIQLRPAAFFVLPVVRRPSADVATALGGGYPASGAPGEDRLPTLAFPEGLRYDPQEAAGEVQTPLRSGPPEGLGIGDRVYLRHAKAGELCERFNSLHLVRGGDLVDEVPTYRGDGRAFL